MTARKTKPITVNEDLRCLVRAYADQLDEVGQILVRAGILTDREIGRQGVQFALRDHFEPLKPVAKKPKKKAR